MKKDLQLKDKIGKYTAAAASVAAFSAAAHGQVMYTDIADQTSGMGDPAFPIDINGDATNDFALQMASNTGSAWYVGMITPYTTGQSMNDAMGSFGVIGYASALSMGNMISSGGTWITSDARFVIASMWSGNSYGNFTTTPEYMGVRFDISGSTHYGWIRCSGTRPTVTATIYDWAYEATAGVPIMAGDMGGTDVSENFADNVHIASINNIVNISMIEMPDNGTVDIMNTMGQVVHSEAITDFVMNINLENLAAGVYVVNVQGEGQSATQKIYLR